MASRMDCVHVVVCDKQKVINHNISKSVCRHFKNLSRFIEQVRARWVKNEDGIEVCSNCGKSHVVTESGEHCLSAYCPNCGANMFLSTEGF